MQKKMFIISVMTIVVTVLGMIMLISGLVLRYFDTNRNSSADKVQMPEEYIDEFFSDENSEPRIEDYIEPEFE